MSRVVAEPGPVLRSAVARLRDVRVMNPVWIPVLKAAGPGSGPGGDVVRHLAERALVAPVVVAVSATIEGTTEQLTIALDGEGAVLVTEREGAEGEWMDTEPSRVSEILRALLADSPALSAPPRMTSRRDAAVLRATPEQRRAIAERVAEGTPAVAAIAAQTDLDAGLRDALLADGDRAVAEVSFFRPPREDTPPWSFHLLRRWTVGNHGLYSADGEDGVAAAVHRVRDGDVLGTLLPLLDEGAALVGLQGARS